jgi:hypothetical protein
MEKNIKQSVEHLFSNKEHYDVVEEFSRKLFFDNLNSIVVKDGVSIDYKGFEILNINKLRINYTYSYGNMEMDDHFDIEIN